MRRKRLVRPTGIVLCAAAAVVALAGRTLQVFISVQHAASAPAWRRSADGSADADEASLQRRTMATLTLSAAAGFAGLTSFGSPPSASAAPKPQFSKAEATKILQQCDADLESGLASWKTIAPKGGDAVRRIAWDKSLKDLTPALKSLTGVTDDPDVVDQAEAIEEARRQADFMAYSSIFCGTAAGGGTGNPSGSGFSNKPCNERYIEDARKEFIELRTELKKMVTLSS
eukprot:TRINITY_DN53643_c1_g2_i1.p1 TRINITY_DN53643_c1_g2~~TRINITY_DN53643_c1_g2_i1.p1  ORF type:complete len:253 (+),score=61.17 TRINITY_DN53643_c1_g2_i1:74-760(+)